MFAPCPIHVKLKRKQDQPCLLAWVKDSNPPLYSCQRTRLLYSLHDVQLILRAEAAAAAAKPAKPHQVHRALLPSVPNRTPHRPR